MRNGAVLIFSLLLFACKNDKVLNEVDKDTGSQFGIEDYAEIVRHPISLDSNIDTSLWSDIEFMKNEFNFDTTEAGSIIKKSFEFINSGSKPLYILDTRVSCGCTAAAHSKEAVEPGGSGKIDVEFDTTGKQGEQNKTIIVLSNSHPNEDRLVLRGYVK